MDRQEAKQVLQALRPNDLSTDQPAVIEALVFVEHDPELKVWWEAQQAFDLRVAAKLKEVPVPADLRATILAGRKIKQLPPPQPRFSLWLAAAAAVAILCVAGTSMHIAATTGPLAQTEYNTTVLPLLNHDAPELAMTSTDQNKLLEWLREQDAPTGDMPQKMTSLSTVGCQKYVIHGHIVSLICFTMAGGGLVHLFTVDQKALSDPPPDRAPEFNQIQGWSTASWSDGRMSYMLVTQAGPDALRQLL